MAGLLSWAIPGGGHFLVGQRVRALIIFVTILLTFCTGLYIGSIGVVDLSRPSASYLKGGQILNGPTVFFLSDQARVRGLRAYGWPSEIGEIYTVTSGLLNLLCVVNAVYIAHLGGKMPTGD
jgi:hypothetical protein